MKNNVIRTIIIICFTLLAISSHTQTLSVSNLVGTKWECKENGKSEIWEFKKDSVIETISYKYIQKTRRYTIPFYLSNDKEEPFDMNKVGSNTSGKYLFEWNSKLQCKMYCEISSMTADKLVLFYEAKEDYVGGNDYYETYSRVR